MNLTQRERVLAAGVGLVIALFIGNYFYTSIRKGFEAKQAKISTLQEQVEQQKLQMTAGIVAKSKLNRLVAESLPSNDERARAEYMEWLIDLAEQAGLSDPLPRSIDEAVEKGVYRSFKFNLTGTGTVETATKLLHAFQSKDYLHRILRYDMRPMTNSNPPNRLTISMDCEALALMIAKPDQAPPASNSPRITKPLESYIATIAGRNIFAPTNHPPRFVSSSRVEATQGIRVEHAFDVKEDDPGQTLSYAIEGEAPRGVQVDSATGKLTWTSTELGEFKVDVRATDSGIPARSSTQSLTIKVAEPPPPAKSAPKFDVASQAFVSALVSDGKGPAAWVRSKTDGKTIYLRKGDELKLGDVVGKVVDLGSTFMELETDGKRWLVGLDESLADAYKRSMED
jgi:hypothetical protein